MRYFKFKNGVGGNHVEQLGGEPITYKSEDKPVIPSLVDLDVKFPDKFEETEAPAPAKKKTSKKAASKKSAPKTPSLGKDVTSEYATAVEEDLKVYGSKDGYFVAEADAPNKAVNDSPLKKDEVEDFLTKYLEE